MAAYSAFLRGASKIYVVDKVPERLAAAKKIAGCIPVDFSAGEDAVNVIIKDNDGKMVDRVRTCRNLVSLVWDRTLSHKTHCGSQKDSFPPKTCFMTFVLGSKKEC